MELEQLFVLWNIDLLVMGLDLIKGASDKYVMDNCKSGGIALESKEPFLGKVDLRLEFMAGIGRICCIAYFISGSTTSCNCK